MSIVQILAKDLRISTKCAETIPKYFHGGLVYNVDVLIKHKQPKEENMKKISLVAMVGAIASLAAYAGPGNMNNNMMEVVTVEQVRGMTDNSPVIIRGYLLRKNGENSYVFQDNTGTINLEIDEEDWGGLTVAPTDFVEVWGEVDKNGTSMIEVDVSAIKKL